MKLNVSAEAAFSIGKNYLYSSDYVNAKKYLEFAENGLEDKSKVTYQLFRLDLKTGNYKQARERLKSGNITDKSLLLSTLGQLETIEFNFDRARDILNEDLKSTKFSGRTMLSLARLDIQTGDFERAQHILERLEYSWEYGIKSSFELVYLDILKQDYESARKRLSEILKSNQKTGSGYLNRRLKNYISVLIGDFKPHYLIRPDKNYPIYRAMYPEDEQALIEHIENHKEGNEVEANFFDETDIATLLKQVKELLLTIIPNYYKGTNVYPIRFDEPIGTFNGTVTRDMTVVGFNQHDVILSMYPCVYSNEFDSEGYSKNLQFKQERETSLSKVKNEKKRR